MEAKIMLQALKNNLNGMVHVEEEVVKSKEASTELIAYSTTRRVAFLDVLATIEAMEKGQEDD